MNTFTNKPAQTLNWKIGSWHDSTGHYRVERRGQKFVAFHDDKELAEVINAGEAQNLCHEHALKAGRVRKGQ